MHLAIPRRFFVKTYPILNELKASGLPTQADWLIVGLGNPGKQYELTRHNAGFLVLKQLFEREASLSPWLRSKTLNTLWRSASLPINASKETPEKTRLALLLVQPQTFMNLSGEVVAPLLGALNCPRQNLLVVVDDVALPYGKLRLREKGSSGGQNGLNSIIAHLGKQHDFPRLRVGIGPPPSTLPLEAFVLDRFSQEEQQHLPAVIQAAHRALLITLQTGLKQAPQQVNGLSAF
jgi:peptidyl-tRNA hydrolase, PTH1 family